MRSNSNHLKTAPLPKKPGNARPLADTVYPLGETDLICDLSDSSLSFDEICIDHEITREALSTWMMRPDVARRLEVMQTAAMQRARFIGRLNLPGCAKFAADIVKSHQNRPRKATIDAAFDCGTRLHDETALKAVRTLMRFAALTDDATPKPPPRGERGQGVGVEVGEEDSQTRENHPSADEPASETRNPHPATGETASEARDRQRTADEPASKTRDRHPATDETKSTPHNPSPKTQSSASPPRNSAPSAHVVHPPGRAFSPHPPSHIAHPTSQADASDPTKSLEPVAPAPHTVRADASSRGVDSFAASPRLAPPPLPTGEVSERRLCGAMTEGVSEVRASPPRSLKAQTKTPSQPAPILHPPGRTGRDRPQRNARQTSIRTGSGPPAQ